MQGARAAWRSLSIRCEKPKKKNRCRSCPKATWRNPLAHQRERERERHTHTRSPAPHAAPIAGPCLRRRRVGLTDPRIGRRAVPMRSARREGRAHGRGRGRGRGEDSRGRVRRSRARALLSVPSSDGGFLPIPLVNRISFHPAGWARPVLRSVLGRARAAMPGCGGGEPSRALARA